jgi:methyl-accepting chemotaxis protein
VILVVLDHRLPEPTMLHLPFLFPRTTSRRPAALAAELAAAAENVKEAAERVVEAADRVTETAERVKTAAETVKAAAAMVKEAAGAATAGTNEQLRLVDAALNELQHLQL